MSEVFLPFYRYTIDWTEVALGVIALGAAFWLLSARTRVARVAAGAILGFVGTVFLVSALGAAMLARASLPSGMVRMVQGPVTGVLPT